ncbi:SDR family NAD(P)-dependent oxidoreductase [Kitasatospora sp. NPDC087314]|uniref:SDR family NAD(P)-dependent oxidoreductase n=1 Tax=Kitasatospora sp. NPDC087314 TaxID=3364068 RepID=UPI0038054173
MPTRKGDWLLLAGATGLVGAAAARSAAAQGAGLVLLGRSAEALSALAGELAGEFSGTPVHPVVADLTDQASLDAAFAALPAAGVDRLDAVVNLATGYTGRPVPVGELPAEEFRRVVDTDLVGAFLLVRTALPLLRRAPDPRVVLVSSLAGLRGRPGAAHLCAAKAGVNGLALALAIELGEQGVAVNTVAPGPIARPGVPHPPTPVPLASPEQVAAAVLRLTEAADARRGETVIVTGEPIPDPSTPEVKQ